LKKTKKYIPCTKPKIHTSEYIKDDIIKHLMEKKPFSLVRIGDGDLKFLKFCISKIENKIDLKNIDNKNLHWKAAQQGVTFDKIDFIWNIYRDVSNRANYISSFQLYTNRKKSANAKQLLKNWIDVYNKMNIINDKYCDPDISFYLFNDMRLLKTIKDNDFKLCLVTSFEEQNFINLKEYGIKFKVLQIPQANKVRNKVGKRSFINNVPVEKWHINEYDRVKSELIEECKNSDIFFVAGGMIGRSYTNIVKQNGKVAVDLGKMVNYWITGRIPGRFNKGDVISKNKLIIKANNRFGEIYG